MTTKYAELQMFYKKLSPGLAALIGAGAGWALSDSLVEAPRGQMTVSQRREWDRVVNEAMRNKRDSRNRRALRKDMYSILRKDHAPIPPKQGLVWDPAKKRWTNPDNVGKTVIDVQGRKRIRGTGTGVHEHALATGGAGGKGEGSAEAGRRFRSANDAGIAMPHRGKHPSTSRHAKPTKSALDRFKDR